MKIEGEGQLLRIFVGESDRWEGRPLYEAIVRAAREAGLAGATALRGIEGFGANSRIHTVKILRLSEDLPIVIEIVDRADRITAFMPTIDKMVSEGMVTLEKINVLLYRHQDENHSKTVVDDEDIPLESPADVTAVDPQVEFSTSTERTRQIIEKAKESAAGSHRVFVDSVDVLLAMLREPAGMAGRLLEKLGVEVRTVTRCLTEEVSRDEPSDAYLTSLEARSLAAAKWLDHPHVSTEHLLLGLCEIRPTAATDILMRLGVQPRDVCKEVLEILGHEDDWQRWLADHPDM